MSKAKDLTGQRFGRLVALEPTDERKHRYIIWKCLCECGKICYVQSGHLSSGHTQSCNCLQKEKNINRNKNNAKHNLSHHRLFEVWSGMKKRCYELNDISYKNYGGRGITVCNEWLHDFKAFYNWAMANGYDENAPRGKCTLDRIDVDGNYCPENCRWVDMKTQANNRRNNKNNKKEN